MINEYEVLVLKDNKKEVLKTYADCVEEAIDNLVLIEGISRLYMIKDVNLQEIWDFDEDISGLRELRNLLPPDIRISFGVKNDTIH
jgi:hypothetical protein